MIRWRRASVGVWLALAALGLNALLPVHLALDLGEAFAAAPQEMPRAPHHGPEWRFWALLSGHETGDAKLDHGHGPPACPAFGALGAVGGYAMLAAPALPLPVVVAASPMLEPTVGEPDRAPAAAYRSRAPPLA